MREGEEGEEGEGEEGKKRRGGGTYWDRTDDLIAR